MRHLFILNGANQAEGAAFIQSQGLRPWLIEQDVLEALFGSIIADTAGKIGPDRYHLNRARNRILSILSEKMATGSLIVFSPAAKEYSATRQDDQGADLISALISCAALNRYIVHSVDFSGALSSPAPAVDFAIHHHNVATLKGSLLEIAEPETLDFDCYRNIVVIGDIHGCDRTLGALTDNHEIRNDTAYVFLGDYINKGPRSGQVMRLLLERYMSRDNCHFLAGNHETGLEGWARGDTSLRRVFADTSLCSIMDAGIAKADAFDFLGATRDVLKISWRGLAILASHGGLACPPGALAPLSGEHFRHGTEGPHFDVDAAWARNILCGNAPDPARMIQVHGHRNPSRLGIAAARGSFNLEDEIDRGGPLRALALAARPGGYDAHCMNVPNRDIHARKFAS